MYHFHNFYFGVNTQIVERNFEILLHLNGIIFELSDRKETHLAMSPGAVLPQKERQQHQQASVVNDPPNINKSADLFKKGRMTSRFAILKKSKQASHFLR
jgi:hypothetical protein